MVGEPVSRYQRAVFWLISFWSLRVCSRSLPMKLKCWWHSAIVLLLERFWCFRFQQVVQKGAGQPLECWPHVVCQWLQLGLAGYLQWWSGPWLKPFCVPRVPVSFSQRLLCLQLHIVDFFVLAMCRRFWSHLLTWVDRLLRLWICHAIFLLKKLYLIEK